MEELKAIRKQLKEMAEKEAIRLWRLARNAEKHDCSHQLVSAIRDEGWWISTNGVTYPERLLDWKFEYEFKYAFR